MDPDGATEDPATGSAAGPLLAYLHEREGLSASRSTRRSRWAARAALDCALEDDRIRVGGDCVVVATGSVTLGH